MTTSPDHSPGPHRVGQGSGLWAGGGSLRASFALSASVFLALACASQLENRYADRLDVSSYPKEIRDAYEVFAVRCSRCHSLARPFNARITNEEHWVRYVARMRRQPGSGINRRNGQEILKFLLYYTAELRRAESGDVETEETIAEPAVAEPAVEESEPATTVAPTAAEQTGEPASPRPPSDPDTYAPGVDEPPSPDAAPPPPPASPSVTPDPDRRDL